MAALPVIAAVLLLAGPRARVEGDWHVPEIGPDVDAYVRASEARVPDLRPGDGKRILWADTATHAPTPLAIVYLHGFSADPHEVEPLVSELVRDLGANAYFQRLAGHGRAAAAMGEVEADDWLSDAAEAVAVGARLGDRVILMGTSTGGTLAAWAALQPELERDVAAVVLLSPNFQPADHSTKMLLWPWGGLIARMVVGPERCFETHNAAQARHWTSCYPTSVLLPMMAIVEHVRTSDLEAARTPLLVAYAPDDRIVDTGEIRSAFERWGTPAKRLLAVATPGDPDRHVLAGDILSPHTTELVRAAILDFLRDPARVLPLPIENRPAGH